MVPCNAKTTNLRENSRGNRIKDHGKNISIYHITVQPFTIPDSFPCGVPSVSTGTNNAESVLSLPV
jgi:hypothetical protein